MSKHVWVNTDRLKRGRAIRVVDGIELTVEISPYSVPKAVVGVYDKKRGRFNIEFKYIDNEVPGKPFHVFGGVVIEEGKHSRKILMISIPVDAPSMEKVGIITLKTKIVNAFRERIRDVTDPDSPDSPDVLNQEVAEEILDPEMLKELAGDLVS
jgi:hypothetical protein